MVTNELNRFQAVPAEKAAGLKRLGVVPRTQFCLRRPKAVDRYPKQSLTRAPLARAA
jgi:hypothetical protein